MNHSAPPSQFLAKILPELLLPNPAKKRARDTPTKLHGEIATAISPCSCVGVSIILQSWSFILQNYTICTITMFASLFPAASQLWSKVGGANTS